MFPTVHTAKGHVDMIAVDRWLAGDDVTLNDVELLAAAHAAVQVGISMNTLRDRLHMSWTSLKKFLSTPSPIGEYHQFFNPRKEAV